MPATIPHCSEGLPGPCWWDEQANPADTEASTAQTVRGMCGEVHQAAADDYVRSTAGELQRVNPRRDRAAGAWSAFWCAKHRVKFVPDEINLGRLLHKYGELDFLQSPSVLLRQRKPTGDCDCFTMLVCALLECMGIPWRICTLKCDAREPGRWSHVYCCAILEDGSRLPLDASHGPEPGWEVPARDVFEYAEWDPTGARLPVALRPRPMGQYMPGGGYPGFAGVRGFRGLRGFGGRRRGLGQDDGSGGSLDFGSIFSSIDPNATTDIALANSSQPVAPIGGGSASTSSGSSSPAISNALAQMANSWTKIAGQVIAPQTTILGPGGTMITGPSGAIQSITNPLTAFSATGNMGSILLIGAAVVAGIFALKAVSGK